MTPTLERLRLWARRRRLDEVGTHFHLYAFHRHPDWRGHPNADRWHFHGPYRHDHNDPPRA